MRHAAAVTSIVVGLTIGSAAFGATAKNLSENTTPNVLPPLVQNVAVVNADSDLVKAAKKTVAQRLTGKSSGWVIDATMVRSSKSGGRMVVANESIAQVPVYAGPSSGGGGAATPPPAPYVSPASTAATSAERARLQSELGRVAQEAEQQYGDEMDEGVVEQRIVEIPQRINEIDQSQPRPTQP